jgi:predicted nucleic acid-binding protein
VSVAREEADGITAARAIELWTRAGRQMVVPAHFWLEVANAIGVRHRLPGSAVLQAIHIVDRLGFETFETDRAHLVLTIDLSERHGLTVYDAAYLALAISLDGSLVTLDQALRSAAGSRAIDIGQPRMSELPALYEQTVTWPSYKGASAFLAKLRAEAATPR